MEDKRTRIVCTIGPASSSVSTLSKMIRAGMNVARLNFSHGSHADQIRVLKHVRTAAKKLNTTVAILQDLQGPKIRVGNLPEEGVSLRKGERIAFTTATDHYKKDGAIPVTYSLLHKDLKKDHRILLDDGRIEAKVKSVRGRLIHAVVHVPGVLKSHKGMNLPDSKVSVSSFTEKDKEDLRFGVEHGVDFVALSFVTDPKVIDQVRRRAERLAQGSGTVVPRIIVKIERKEVLDVLPQVLEKADGVMLARGDLGIEIPPEDVPILQKDVVEACRVLGKPVIVATHMLDSMTQNPRATRAETSDVANAVIDHADAVMLSQETAMGEYPVKTVETMSAIIRKVEASRFDDIVFYQVYDTPNLSSSIAQTLHIMADNQHISAIVTASTFGDFSTKMNVFRPKAPIFVACPDETTARQWVLSAGITPFVAKDDQATFIHRTESLLRKQKKIRSKQKVAFVTVSAKGDVQLTLR